MVRQLLCLSTADGGNYSTCHQWGCPAQIMRHLILSPTPSFSFQLSLCKTNLRYQRNNRINERMTHEDITSLHTLYLALLTMRLPSRSQLTDGLGLPKAVQVKVMLPPSLASTYWGGVSVNVGGAEESKDKETLKTLKHVSKGRTVSKVTKTDSRFCYQQPTALIWQWHLLLKLWQLTKNNAALST